jgi:hypothetical protein
LTFPQGFLTAYQRRDIFLSQRPQVLTDLIVNPLTLRRMMVPVPEERHQPFSARWCPQVWRLTGDFDHPLRGGIRGQQGKQPFRNAAQADSYRSSLLAAARNGQAFSIVTGRPISWQREESPITWYDLVLDYSAMKWPYASPHHRRSTAEALIDATEVMLTRESPWPIDDLRNALRRWAFSGRIRGQIEPSDDLSAVVRWLGNSTIAVTDLVKPVTGPARTRAMLDRISKTKLGTAAAANTANRKRAVLSTSPCSSTTRRSPPAGASCRHARNCEAAPGLTTTPGSPRAAWSTIFRSRR